MVTLILRETSFRRSRRVMRRILLFDAVPADL